MKKPQIVQRRPAETGSLSLATVVGAALAVFKIDLEPTQVAGLVILIGATPAGLSGLVDWWRAREARSFP